ncbi:MAG TPA: coniferyl aldehyde dehydrogenase [Beijerinckiaceae bacterium]|nr:coniferyl aldehyde dehydrogenase [Beijerinckiaceae bacterium]
MSSPPPADDRDRLETLFAAQRALSRRVPFPDLSTRRSRLERLLALLVDNQTAFEQAISADFGHRSVQETRLAEAFVAEAGIRHILSHLKHWMQPRRIKTELAFLPGSNRLMPQPLGAVGIIAPWNYPLQLTINPVAAAFAAGNLVMLKPSEFTPAFSSLLARLVADLFAPEDFTIIEGGADVARQFADLPFDHLFFTGSTKVGRLVAQAAARNLTPVTLELGGKSPAIIDASADIAKAAGRIAFGKLLNAGQTCIAPDYVLCPPEREAEFISAYKAAVARLYGADAANPDYSAIITDRHFSRLEGLIDDAAARGARIDYAVADPAAWKARRKFPPCLVQGASAEMLVMQEEIFGPILPVLPIADTAAAIAQVNAGDRPLALYWFGTDAAARDRVLAETVSGGVTINDCLVHIAQENQPFGGVGASGMGAYHGEWGFRTFSHDKPIFYRPELSGLGLMQPPYGKTFDRMLAQLRRII